MARLRAVRARKAPSSRGSSSGFCASRSRTMRKAPLQRSSARGRLRNSRSSRYRTPSRSAWSSAALPSPSAATCASMSGFVAVSANAVRAAVRLRERNDAMPVVDKVDREPEPARLAPEVPEQGAGQQNADVEFAVLFVALVQAARLVHRRLQLRAREIPVAPEGIPRDLERRAERN